MEKFSSSKSMLAASAVALGLTGCGGSDANSEGIYESKDFQLSLESRPLAARAMANTQEATVNLLDTSSYVLVAQGAKESIVDATGTIVPGVQCKAVIKKTGKKLTALADDNCSFIVPNGTEENISVVVTTPDGYQNEFSPKPINIDVKAPTLTIPTHDYMSISGQPFTYTLKSPETLDITQCTITFQDGTLPAITLDPSKYQITTAGNNSYNIVVPYAPLAYKKDNHLVDYTTHCPDSSGNMGSIKFSVPSF